MRILPAGISDKIKAWFQKGERRRRFYAYYTQPTPVWLYVVGIIISLGARLLIDLYVGPTH